MTFYVGFAIDQANTPPQKIFEEWTTAFEIIINEHYKADKLGNSEVPMVFFNPFAAYKGAKGLKKVEDIAYIVKINDLALMEADFAIFLWQDSPSFGVPYEILKRLEKGNILVHNTSGKSAGLYLQHHLNLGKNSHLTDGSPEDLCKKLKWMVSYNDKQNTKPEKEENN